MAKTVASNMKLTGKLGELVHINNKASGPHVRKAPKKGAKKSEKALKLQNSRTAFLNGLASEVNNLVKQYCDHFKSADFYQRVQSIFRKEPLDDRLFLLSCLKQLEINSKYPFAGLGSCMTTVKPGKNKIVVDLKVQSDPNPGKHNANSYYFEVILACWDKQGNPVLHSSQLSEWIPMDRNFPLFEFSFQRPADSIHWLLCLQQFLGEGETKLGLKATRGMIIADVGSFDEKEQAALQKKIETERAMRLRVHEKKEEKELMRVKALRKG